jgi:hypothetical protein
VEQNTSIYTTFKKSGAKHFNLYYFYHFYPLFKKVEQNTSIYPLLPLLKKVEQNTSLFSKHLLITPQN